MFLNRSGRMFALCSCLLVTGCSSMGSTGNLFPAAGDNAIKIESDPSGAEVYVMGEKIGVTPLQIHHQDVFPNIYPKEKISVYGKVTLKKEGCADFTRTISGEISNNGLNAKLNCGGSSSASPGIPSPATSGDVPRTGETVERRLEKIKELLGKGLITEEEAKKTRERILDDL